MGAYGNANKESQIQDYMAIYKDLVCNIVVPFNYGWRKNPDFEHYKKQARESPRL